GLFNVEVRVMPLDGSNNVLTSPGGTIIQEDIGSGWGPASPTIPIEGDIVYIYWNRCFSYY
ncbi:MAG: hypothetical protein V3R57_08160, partial [Candidatus Bathyarchaeia archaeon]